MIKLNNRNKSISFSNGLPASDRKEKKGSFKITFIYFAIVCIYLLLSNVILQSKNDHTIQSILTFHYFKDLIALIFSSLFIFQLIYKNSFKLKKDELELKKLYKVIEQSSTSIMIMDEYGNIEYVNPRCTQLTGHTYEEMLGKHYSTFHLFEIDGIGSPKELRDLISLSQDWKGELQIKKKNGESFWGYVSISSIKNEENKITHYIAEIEDVTIRKMMEEKLKSIDFELKQKIEELKEFQSQLIYQEEHAAIGQLAAGIAHEINNLLGFIKSNFDVLEKYFYKYKKVIEAYQALKNSLNVDVQLENINLIKKEVERIERENNISFINEDLEELFRDSHEGIKRLNEIIKGLRVFSRKGQFDTFEDYDLNEGIKSTVVVARNELKYHAKVEEYLGEIPIIHAIGGEINQVLLNLLLNAVYAIREKQSKEIGLIKIRTFYEDGYVYCEIEDNGIGIEEKNISSIFNPFFTTKPIGEGTGLGLSIAYDIIVNKHHGTISVESTKGVGTKFIIRLPIRQNVNSI
ncbi:sensor histidine kinase [Tepidibacillus sp. LV47]|uniref:sensor histidine kinase n=1 Tax=Tepidibacillus sp. LV47 TaxID=3398228 RepID=UPI003AAC76D9